MTAADPPGPVVRPRSTRMVWAFLAGLNVGSAFMAIPAPWSLVFYGVAVAAALAWLPRWEADR